MLKKSSIALYDKSIEMSTNREINRDGQDGQDKKKEDKLLS
jgi:hypothetical protein